MFVAFVKFALFVFAMFVRLQCLLGLHIVALEIRRQTQPHGGTESHHWFRRFGFEMLVYI